MKAKEIEDFFRYGTFLLLANPDSKSIEIKTRIYFAKYLPLLNRIKGENLEPEILEDVKKLEGLVNEKYKEEEWGFYLK